MAGRGTDILLGQGVPDLGGLHILGTERHEARRVDNQLRGRAGGQGDPGSSQFFLSLEDDLFRKFAPPWMRGMLQKLGLKEGERIESRMVTRAIGKAQKNVENYNFDIRKSLVDYDQVRAEQRRVIYTLRQRVLEGEDMRHTVLEMVANRISDAVSRFLPHGEDPNLSGMAEWFRSKFGAAPDLDGADCKDPDRLIDELADLAGKAYTARERIVGLSEGRKGLSILVRRFMPEHGELVRNFAEFSRHVKEDFGLAVSESLVRLPQEALVDALTERLDREKGDIVCRAGAALMRAGERYVLLSKIDEKWKDLLYNMDQLRDIIGMRSFAQQDPKLEYKRDATELFQSMMEAIEEDVTSLVFRMTQVAVDETRLARRWRPTEFRKDEVGQFSMAPSGNGDGEDAPEEKPRPVRVQKRPGRNEPCWCGSGKKYKKCHWPN